MSAFDPKQTLGLGPQLLYPAVAKEEFIAWTWSVAIYSERHPRQVGRQVTARATLPWTRSRVAVLGNLISHR